MGRYVEMMSGMPVWRDGEIWGGMGGAMGGMRARRGEEIWGDMGR